MEAVDPTSAQKKLVVQGFEEGDFPFYPWTTGLTARQISSNHLHVVVASRAMTRVSIEHEPISHGPVQSERQ